MGRSLSSPHDLRISSGGKIDSLPFGTSVSVPLLAGDRGTEQTVALIRRAVHESLSNATVRAAAAQALRGVPAFNDRAAVQAIFDWVKTHIRFTQDPVGHETISSAEWTIRNGIGDCDDINAVLVPALLGVIGHQVRLVTVNDDPTDPQGEFTHIYAEVNLNGQWIPVDAARPGAQLGVTVSRTFRKRIWSLTDSSYQDMDGYRGLNGATVCRGCRGCPGGCLGRTGMGFSIPTWLTEAITAGGTAAKDIISAVRIPTAQILTQSGAQASTAAPAPQSIGGISPVLLLGGVGIAALLIAGKK